MNLLEDTHADVDADVDADSNAHGDAHQEAPLGAQEQVVPDQVQRTPSSPRGKVNNDV